jgi:hypothetical protein
MKINKFHNLEIKTWIYEALIVSIFLIMSLLLNNLSFEAILSAIAVFYSFMHIQVADRLQEQESLKNDINIECYNKLNKYLILKEVLWVMFFIISGAYPALLGCILFIFYPLWRKYYRSKIKPLKKLNFNKAVTFNTEYYKPLIIKTKSIINSRDMMHIKKDSEYLLNITKSEMNKKLFKELEHFIEWKITQNFDNSTKLTNKITIGVKN